ncbi:thiolase family protein [Chondromyces apiculatus]|uniref:acetyl-CoA C-acyltransferase n=1 Tax=Chondromyces apiculatus DSM 436 TaxID=1192034 RepID=A0A017SWL3_9BACT|nr:acetyl-CoA C-acyltransferase [Chondromyces apiculatus]EYF01359.1 3-ketoacyl-CoA thiolase [Chondromyces apiculatus DSM 436]
MAGALRNVFVVDAVRTPIGRYAGGLASVRPDDLAALVIQALVQRQPGVAPRLDQVVFGATNQAGEDNRNVARMAALIAGLPYEVPGVTVNRLCGSGLEAVADAARMIAVGEAECAIAGGVESMTRAPFSMPKAAEKFDRTPPPVYDTTLGWRYPNPKMSARFDLQSMGETAENVAKKYGIGREDQDRFALTSHERATAAWEAGEFAGEVVKVEVPQRKGAAVVVERDESVRADASLEALAKLKPVFREGGTVTAGNSSPINDGASGLLLVSEEVVKATGVKPLARVVGTATAGVEPNLMGEGPIPAVRKLLQRSGLRAPNVDLVELNEAFAAQALACVRALELDPAKVNVRGGGIALGHPIGSSGARIACTLVHAMRDRGARLGMAALCIGVGQGIATLFEKA